MRSKFASHFFNRKSFTFLLIIPLCHRVSPSPPPVSKKGQETMGMSQDLQGVPKPELRADEDTCMSVSLILDDTIWFGWGNQYYY